MGIAIYQICVTMVIVLYQWIAAIIQFKLCLNLDKYFTLLKVPEAGTTHTLAGKNTPHLKYRLGLYFYFSQNLINSKYICKIWIR